MIYSFALLMLFCLLSEFGECSEIVPAVYNSFYFIFFHDMQFCLDQPSGNNLAIGHCQR